MRALRFAAVTVLALPGVAHAGNVAMVDRDLPLSGARALAAAQTLPHFNMVGIRWQGGGRVFYRAHRLHGHWGRWVEADADTGPDAGSPEARATQGWHNGLPNWIGASDGLRYRVVGDVSRLRAYFLWSRVERVPERRLTIADQPTIIPRSGWKADESIRRAPPRYAPVLRVAIVHHTASSNSYSRAQSAAVVRGIEMYHVKANGWDDIGYNFLVDRYGQIFEGRYGGIDKNVIGAHSQGFNTGSVGIALIGNYGSTRITAAQRDALVRLIAWRLDVAHVDPLTRVTSLSSGNPRYTAGRQVTLRAVSGHRDTGPTSCPGNAAYAELPAIARAVSATGLPKLYEPVVEGALGGKVRFRARLSGSLAWTVRVTDTQGRAVASGAGNGAVVDWTWDATRAGRGPFGWAIEAAGARAATGTLGGNLPTAPVLSGLSATPPLVLPSAPGATGVTVVAFKLGVRARVTATVTDSAGAAVVTLVDQTLAAGPQTLSWVAGALPDGRYTVRVTAKPPSRAAVSTTVVVTVDRTLTGFTVVPSAFSPNGDGINEAATITFGLAAATEGRLELFQAGAPVATLLGQQPLEAGEHTLSWNGTNGEYRLADGLYEARLTVRGATGEVSISAPVTIDTTPPELRLVDPGRLRFWLSEPATVTALLNGQQIVQLEPKGEFTLPFAGPVTSISATATDAAGNVSAPVQWP